MVMTMVTACQREDIHIRIFFFYHLKCEVGFRSCREAATEAESNMDDSLATLRAALLPILISRDSLVNKMKRFD